MKVARLPQDKDITLNELYKKENGVCYLCGGVCDWNDYTIKDGVFIAGNLYPSIDHVVPLAKDGGHTWSNVRLAHRICNAKKCDKMLPPPDLTGDGSGSPIRLGEFIQL